MVDMLEEVEFYRPGPCALWKVEVIGKLGLLSRDQAELCLNTGTVHGKGCKSPCVL